MNRQPKNTQEDAEALEVRFKTGMEHMTVIDRELANLINNYNDGQGSLATLRFENSDIGDSISTKGFTYGPAYTLIKDDGIKFSLVKNVKDPYFLEQDAELREELAFEKSFDESKMEGEESFEAFQKRVANQMVRPENKEKEMKDLKTNTEEVDPDEIFNRFGNSNFSVRLFAARNSFNKALENIINVANELRQLKTKLGNKDIRL